MEQKVHHSIAFVGMIMALVFAAVILVGECKYTQRIYLEQKEKDSLRTSFRVVSKALDEGKVGVVRKDEKGGN